MQMLKSAVSTFSELFSTHTPKVVTSKWQWCCLKKQQRRQERIFSGRKSCIQTEFSLRCMEFIAVVGVEAMFVLVVC
jgi:hypothetical protein